MDLAVIPECFVDTNLIETLVPPRKQYNHQKECGTVTKVMKEKFPDSFALGIIDKDKTEVDYLKEFSIIANSNSLYLHKHKTRHHYIIQISPAIEMFIISEAKSVGLDLGRFHLPFDLNALKKETKTTTSKNDQRFKMLFKAMLHNNASEMKRLAAWIDYIKEATYSIDIGVLKSM